MFCFLTVYVLFDSKKNLLLLFKNKFFAPKKINYDKKILRQF
jgi:hypothetical protein